MNTKWAAETAVLRIEALLKDQDPWRPWVKLEKGQKAPFGQDVEVISSHGWLMIGYFKRTAVGTALQYQTKHGEKKEISRSRILYWRY